MTVPEAKTALLAYRPGVDPIEPDIARALALLESDPQLKLWFEQHHAFQSALRDKLRDLPVPPDLKDKLLTGRGVLRPNFRPWPWLAAAAAVLLVAWVVWHNAPDSGDFNDYRDRIVRNSIRQYQMDITTPDLNDIHRFLSTNGAPAGYDLPPALRRLSVTGAGLLRWQDHPVSMLCFDRGNSNMLFLFVLDRKAVRNQPPEEPSLTSINRFDAASWTTQTNTYILAGAPEDDFLKKYLSPPRQTQTPPYRGDQ